MEALAIRAINGDIIGCVQHHKPFLHEGLCDRCTAYYTRAVDWLGRYEDQFVCTHMLRFHEGGHDDHGIHDPH